jgi:hypothetical protein
MRQPILDSIINENNKQKAFLFIEILAIIVGALEVIYITSSIDFDYYYPLNLYELLQWIAIMALSISPLIFASAILIRDLRKKIKPRKIITFVALSTSPFVIYSAIYAIILIGSFYLDYGVSPS